MITSNNKGSSRTINDNVNKATDLMAANKVTPLNSVPNERIAISPAKEAVLAPIKITLTMNIHTAKSITPGMEM
jgi:hypothetical protein